MFLAKATAASDSATPIVHEVSWTSLLMGTDEEDDDDEDDFRCLCFLSWRRCTTDSDAATGSSMSASPFTAAPAPSHSRALRE